MAFLPLSCFLFLYVFYTLNHLIVCDFTCKSFQIRLNLLVKVSKRIILEIVLVGLPILFVVVGCLCLPFIFTIVRLLRVVCVLIPPIILYLVFPVAIGRISLRGMEFLRCLLIILHNVLVITILWLIRSRTVVQ
jgi:hypothetical protein